MNFIVVDDERLALEDFVIKLRDVNSKSVIKSFQDPEIALKEIKNGFKTDVAFLDIEMYGLSGIELGIDFKKILPKINLIFVTGFSKYAADAFDLHASGYITKPVRADRIKKELENLRNPITSKESRIRIQTFGNFEIFVDGIPLKFKRNRTKELLAYLVDRRGTGCTTSELGTMLWEDRNYDRSLQNQLQVHISDLLKVLKSVEAEKIILKKRNYLSVNSSEFDCDYYKFLEGDKVAVNSFLGEYMTNYSWAELTAGELYQKIND